MCSPSHPRFTELTDGSITQPLGDSLLVLTAHMGRHVVTQRLWVIALTLLKVPIKQNGNSKMVLRDPIFKDWNHSTRLAIGKSTGSEVPGRLPR